jgi:hypothetical protein
VFRRANNSKEQAMRAFNAVRFKVKSGRNQGFINAHRTVDHNWPGPRHVNLIQTVGQTFLHHWRTRR